MTLCIDNNKIQIKQEKIQNIIKLSKKIENAKNIIINAMSNSKYPIIAFSGGKDSLVILNLIRSIYPNIKAVFENTTNEYPETLEFIKTISNIIELHPQKTFMECVHDYGLPEPKSTGKRHGSACCYWLKEKPASDYYKKEKVDLVFTGLTAAESRNRMMMFKRMGSYYFYKKDKYFKCHPIFDWTVEDVWKYIDLKNLQYSKIYDKLGRNARTGCRLCTAYKSWLERAFEYNEKDAIWLMKKKNIYEESLFDF